MEPPNHRLATQPLRAFRAIVALGRASLVWLAWPRSRWVVGAYVSLALVLVIAPISGFLFGSGGLFFQNWNWSIFDGRIIPAPAVLDAYLWTNNGTDPAGYTHSITFWPPFLTLAFTQNSFLVERVFLVYVFAVEFCLAFLGATLMLKLFDPRLAGRRFEALRALFIVVTFVNPAALQWESGVLVPFLWGSSLIGIALLCTLLALRMNSPRLGIPAGIALGLGATLDPRIAVWGGLGVLLILAVQTVRSRNFRASVRFLVIGFLSGLPGVALTAYAYWWSGTTAGPPIQSGTVAAITAASTNATPLRSLELLGYYISGVTYAPPSVLFTPASSLGTLPTMGSPAFSVLDGSIVSAIWLLALCSIPLLALGSLLSRRYRPITVPLALVGLVGSALAAGGTYPFGPVVQLEALIGTIRAGGIGVVAQTVFAVPSWIQVLTEAAFVPLIVVSVASLGFSDGERPEVESPSASQGHVSIGRLRHSLARLQSVRTRRAVAVVAVLLVLLASWQFFSGDFYPGGLSPGVSPNWVPSSGSLAPATPPPSDVDAIRSLSSETSAGAVYWPGTTSYAYPWNERWSPPVAYSTPFVVVRAPGLGTAIGNGLESDIGPLLGLEGISSVVVDNMSSGGLELSFGTGNLSQVLTSLTNAPTVHAVSIATNGASIFGLNQTPGVVTLASTANTLSIPAGMAAIAAGALKGANRSAALLTGGGTETAPQIGFAGPNSVVSSTSALIATASNLSALSQTGVVRAAPGGPNATVTASFASTGEHDLPAPYANWSVAVWGLEGGNVTVSTAAGQQFEETHDGSSALVSLNYLSSLVDGSQSGIRVDPGSSVAFRVSAEVRSDGPVQSEFWLNVVSSNSSRVNNAQFSSAVAEPGSSWTPVNLSGVLPLESALFTLRMFSNLSGSLEIRNVTLAWSELTSTSSSFSGQTASVTNSTAVFVTTTGSTPVGVWIQASGLGSISVSSTSGATTFPVHADRLQWIGATGLLLPPRTQVSFVGKFNVSGVLLLPAAGSSLVGSVYDLDMGSGGYTFTGQYTAPSASYLTLHVPYLAQWMLSIDGRGSQTGAAGELGGVVFSVPAGTHSFQFSLNQLGDQPILLWVGGLTYGVLIVLAFWKVPAESRLPVVKRHTEGTPTPNLAGSRERTPPR